MDAALIRFTTPLQWQRRSHRSGHAQPSDRRCMRIALTGPSAPCSSARFTAGR